nr:hypothetical protein [Tanacetum cinerariifolium]
EAAATLTGTAVGVIAETYGSAAGIVVLATLTDLLAAATTFVISLAMHKYQVLFEKDRVGSQQLVVELVVMVEEMMVE